MDHMQRDPLHLPEILILIGRHLCQNDLATCIRVSHSWHSAMAPLLWTSVSLGLETNVPSAQVSLYPEPQAVIRNIHRIHSLELAGPSMSVYLQSIAPQLSNQLVHLSVTYYSPYVNRLLVQNSRSLRSFTCLDFIAPQPQQLLLDGPSALQIQEATTMWTTLSSLAHLDTLSLTHVLVYERHHEMFFKICRQLTSLTLERGKIFNMYPPNKQPFPKMKRLQLKRNSVAVHDQPRFIMQCPNLEHLAWTPIHSMPFTSLVFHLTTLPRGEPCRIASLDFTNTDLADKDFALVLSCIPTLRRLIAIESPFAEMCCLQVVYFMSETLEELDLRNCVSVTSAFIQLILLTCKRMKRFRADQLDAGIMVARPADYKTTSSSQLQTSEEARSWISSIRNASAAISSPPSSSSHQISEMTSPHMDWTWACTGLEELELTFRELGNYGDSVTDVLFDQLAALTQLQKLVLGWHHDSSKKKGLLPEPLLDTQLATLDLSLRCGGLSKLRTLTNLRDFDVQHVDLMAMTIEDVLWMGEHWKSLRRLRGALTADKTEEDRIRAALAKDYLHITLL